MKYGLKFLFVLALFWGSILFAQDTTKADADSVIAYDSHPQDFQSKRGFYIHSPDRKSYLLVYGSIRLNGAYDIGGLQTKQSFSTYDIPVGETNSEGRFFMSPYQSRLGLAVKLNSRLGDVNLKLESDFLGSGNSFRIRHAYGALRSFLLGQTWSVFGDPNSIPTTVDQDGPNSSVAERTIQLRYQAPKALLNLIFAIESPNAEISNPDSLELEPVFQSFPEITSRFLIEAKWGHFQVAGIFRSITVRNADQSLDVLAGYGGLLSSKINFSKSFLTNIQITAGKGTSHYIKGLTGKGQDVVYDHVNKTNKLLPVYGGFVSGAYQWNKYFSSTITMGLLRIINLDFQPDDAFKESYYGSVNSFYITDAGFSAGLEYSTGRRINKDGSHGIANRVSFIGILYF
jgi:hypothetical protein